MKMKFLMKDLDLLNSIRTNPSPETDKIQIKRKGDVLIFSSLESAPLRTKVEYSGTSFGGSDDDIDVLVNKTVFMNELNHLNNEESINIETLDNGKFSIYNNSKKIKYKISIEPNKYMESSNEGKEVLTAIINAEDFLTKASKVRVAAAIKDTSRASFEGICIDFIDDKTLNMCAVDGRRISFDSMTFESKNGLKEKKISVPLIFIDDIKKYNNINKLDKLEISVINGNVISCDLGNVIVESKLFEDKFPDYVSLLKSWKRTNTFEVPMVEFITVIKKSFVEKNDVQKKIFEIDSKGTKVMSMDNISEVEIEIDALKSTVPFKFATSYPYIMDYLNMNKDIENVVCYFDGPRQALIFKNGNYEYIIMPMEV